jgi:hypothetical protein
VVAIRVEADGDRHIRLQPDVGQEALLIPGNASQGGNLLLEATCVTVGAQSDSIASCSADPDPLRDLPSVGQHIWAEGRYVIDLDHSWAELHSLYRWGAQ